MVDESFVDWLGNWCDNGFSPKIYQMKIPYWMVVNIDGYQVSMHLIDSKDSTKKEALKRAKKFVESIKRGEYKKALNVDS